MFEDGDWKTPLLILLTAAVIVLAVNLIEESKPIKVESNKYQSKIDEAGFTATCMVCNEEKVKFAGLIKIKYSKEEFPENMEHHGICHDCFQKTVSFWDIISEKPHEPRTN
jgi:hypothetical protein